MASGYSLGQHSLGHISVYFLLPYVRLNLVRMVPSVLNILSSLLSCKPQLTLQRTTSTISYFLRNLLCQISTGRMFTALWGTNLDVKQKEIHCGSSQHCAPVRSVCLCVDVWTQDIPIRTPSFKVSFTYIHHRNYFASEKVFEINHLIANSLVVSVFTLYFYIGLLLVLHLITLHFYVPYVFCYN